MRKSSPNPNPGSNHNFDEIKFCVSCYAQLLENQVHMLNLRKSSSVFPVLLNSCREALFFAWCAAAVMTRFVPWHTHSIYNKTHIGIGIGIGIVRGRGGTRSGMGGTGVRGVRRGVGGI